MKPVYILTPSGKCPVKLPSTSREDVMNWANRLQDVGSINSPPKVYLPEALQYWIRDFYEIFGPEYNEVKNILREEFNFSEKRSEDKPKIAIKYDDFIVTDEEEIDEDIKI
jgi:hypothetical protein